MHLIQVRNAPGAFHGGLHAIMQIGEERTSRAGDVLCSAFPVTTHYTHPVECVIFDEDRDANPFFHLMEAVWMLAGEDSTQFISSFNAGIARFAEDDGRFHGAYGKRWRSHWKEMVDIGPAVEGRKMQAARPVNQLNDIAQNLIERPDCRRQVLCMWDPLVDRDRTKRDIPCNFAVHFQRQTSSALDMTVFCRSNDIVWGCYGSDVVTFSILQQYMAARIGCDVGNYWQVSDNWHGYVDTIKPLLDKLEPDFYDPYSVCDVTPYQLKGDMDAFDADLQILMSGGAIGYQHSFTKRILEPMRQAYEYFRAQEAPLRYTMALETLGRMPEGSDWRLACEQFIQRRFDKWKS